MALHLVLSSYAAVNFCFSVVHKCAEFTQVKNVATCTSFITRGLYFTLWEGERGIPTFLICILPLQREREGEGECEGE